MKEKLHTNSAARSVWFLMAVTLILTLATAAFMCFHQAFSLMHERQRITSRPDAKQSAREKKK